LDVVHIIEEERAFDIPAISPPCPLSTIFLTSSSVFVKEPTVGIASWSLKNWQQACLFNTLSAKSNKFLNGLHSQNTVSESSIEGQ
jgi:hypothetical protein